jgi:phage protein D
MLARYASFGFYYNGEDVSKQISPFITSFKYSDSIENKADTVEVTLDDAQKLFLKGGWLPLRGTEMSIEIIKNNWNTLVYSQVAPQLKLPLGTFEIDEIEYNYPPSQIVLKFNSIPAKAELRGIARNKSWEQTTLSRIASDIAGRAGLQLFYDVNDDPEIKRAEQRQTADLPFLERLCKDAGLSIKIHDKKLVIFDAAKYESKAPVIVLDYKDPPVVLRFNSKATSVAIYSDAKVSFDSNNIAEWLFGLFGGNDLFTGAADIAGIGGDGGTLNINQKVNSEAEAQRLARAKLREKNKSEFTLNLNLMGSFSFLAGNVFELRGHGVFDGLYICDRTDHNLSDSGYTTNVSAHRCLKGY